MLQRWYLSLLLAVSLFFLSLTTVMAQTVTVKMYKVARQGQGTFVGSVKLSDTRYGMLITPALHSLPPGMHGFHVHVKPSCADAGMAAGGHFDPQKTGKHLGPYNPNGHLGDLPALWVDKAGNATLPVLAPRLKVAQVIGHALIFHAGGDNYSDIPEKLGGGGARLACGVIH